MVAQHIGLHAPQRCDDGIDLVGDVDAIAPVLDHLLQATNLAFDPAQPWNLPGMVHRHAAVSVLRARHDRARSHLAPMLIGYVRVSKSDGSQTLAPQGDASARKCHQRSLYEDLAQIVAMVPPVAFASVTKMMRSRRRSQISISTPISTTCGVGTQKYAAERSALRWRMENSTSRQLERSSRALAGAVPPRAQDPLALVYDLDWDEGARLQQWLGVVEDTRALPPLLAAALAYDAWISIEPLQHRPWLGALVVSGLLRARGKARHHLPCLNLALRQLPHDRRRSRDHATRLVAFLEAVTLGAGQGIKDHDRWLLARRLLDRKLSGRRKHSKLPALIDLVLARPLVPAGMIAEELGITTRAAQDLVAELGIREMTGRGRYRAWGVL